MNRTSEDEDESQVYPPQEIDYDYGDEDGGNDGSMLEEEGEEIALPTEDSEGKDYFDSLAGEGLPQEDDDEDLEQQPTEGEEQETGDEYPDDDENPMKDATQYPKELPVKLRPIKKMDPDSTVLIDRKIGLNVSSLRVAAMIKSLGRIKCGRAAAIFTAVCVEEITRFILKKCAAQCHAINSKFSYKTLLQSAGPYFREAFDNSRRCCAVPNFLKTWICYNAEVCQRRSRNLLALKSAKENPAEGDLKESSKGDSCIDGQVEDSQPKPVKKERNPSTKTLSRVADTSAPRAVGNKRARATLQRSKSPPAKKSRSNVSQIVDQVTRPQEKVKMLKRPRVNPFKCTPGDFSHSAELVCESLSRSCRAWVESQENGGKQSIREAVACIVYHVAEALCRCMSDCARSSAKSNTPRKNITLKLKAARIYTLGDIVKSGALSKVIVHRYKTCESKMPLVQKPSK